jgi:hypothetical protein
MQQFKSWPHYIPSAPGSNPPQLRPCARWCHPVCASGIRNSFGYRCDPCARPCGGVPAPGNSGAPRPLARSCSSARAASRSAAPRLPAAPRRASPRRPPRAGMSHNWIFIKSSGYRAFIERSRENRWVFWGATAGLFGVAIAAAQVTMGLTNPDLEEEATKDHSQQLAKLPMHAQVGGALGGMQPVAACGICELSCSQWQQAQLARGVAAPANHTVGQPPVQSLRRCGLRLPCSSCRRRCCCPGRGPQKPGAPQGYDPGRHVWEGQGALPLNARVSALDQEPLFLPSGLAVLVAWWQGARSACDSIHGLRRPLQVLQKCAPMACSPRALTTAAARSMAQPMAHRCRRLRCRSGSPGGAAAPGAKPPAATAECRTDIGSLQPHTT